MSLVRIQFANGTEIDVARTHPTAQRLPAGARIVAEVVGGRWVSLVVGYSVAPLTSSRVRVGSRALETPVRQVATSARVVPRVETPTVVIVATDSRRDVPVRQPAPTPSIVVVGSSSGTSRAAESARLAPVPGRGTGITITTPTPRR